MNHQMGRFSDEFTCTSDIFQSVASVLMRTFPTVLSVAVGFGPAAPKSDFKTANPSFVSES